MYLVIAEKPSVAQTIAQVMGAYDRRNGYLQGRDIIVSWCIGHLAKYAMPERYDEKYETWAFEDLPIFPSEWRLEVAPDKKKQYMILKELLSRKDIEYVVNACDAGREGELIFRRVYGLSKSQIPMKRLWISSMEDKAIQQGFRELKPGAAYNSLAVASICRAQADWLVGMNVTRALTTTYNRKLIAGRVQTPTLAMLTEREQEIEGFQKKQYFHVHIIDDALNAVSGKIDARDEADMMAELCSGKPAVVKTVQREEKVVKPPRLYDLTSLQRDANRLFGITAKATLEAAQSLYEAKLITYPRTDSRFLTDDMAETAADVIEAVTVVMPFVGTGKFEPNISRLLNSSKVSDHHAIIPTVELANASFAGLSENERRILCMIAARLLCASSADHKYLNTSAELECEGFVFTARNKQVVEIGWKGYEEAMKGYCKAEREAAEDPDDENSISRFPDLSEGEVIEAVTTDVTEHWTRPPARYTEDTLLSAMEHAGASEMEDDVERKGLGTPATRAATIEKLILSGYAKRYRKQVIPTDEGKLLIKLMPDYLKSAALTAEWENQLLLMERGQRDPGSFINGIKKMLSQVLTDCSNVPEEERSKYRKSKDEERENIGACPNCGKPVREGSELFFCTDRNCPFCIWKKSRFLSSMKKELSAKEASDLLTDGRAHLKHLYSAKKDKYFDADLVMTIVDGRPNYRLEFANGKKGQT